MIGKKSILNFCIKLGLTILVLGLLVHLVGWEKIGNALLQTNLYWLLGMFFVSLCNRLIAAFQMHTLLGWVGLNVKTGRVFLANSLASLYSLIVPGDLIAASAKWANLSAITGKKSMTLNAIIYNRLASLFPYLLMGGTALILDDPFRQPVFRFVIFGLLLLVICGAVFLYNPRLGCFADKIMLKIARFFPDAIASRIEMLITSLLAFRAMTALCHVKILFISVVATLVSVGNFILASYAVGIEIPIITMLWIMALLQVVRLVPITISNIGVREGALVVILGMNGIAAEKAVALGLILFSASLLIALVGLGYQISLALGLARWGPQSS